MKIYVVYEVYLKEIMNINGFVTDIEYLRTFEKENNMISYIHCELESQCFEDDNWTYNEEVKKEYYIGTVYFCGEEQYKIIGKEISLEKRGVKMTNKEILAELKKSYEYLRDIRENGCADHCTGQLDAERTKHLENAIDELAVVYHDFREILDDKECMINLKDKGTFYIGKYIDEDYCELYNDKDNYTYWVTCEDIDYYWYEDKDFLEEKK